MSGNDNKNVGEEISVAPLVAPQNRYAEALRLLLTDSRSEQTRRAYASDLRDFFGFLGQEIGPVAVEQFCSLSLGDLALVLNDFKASLRGRGLAEATINRRLTAVRSLLRMARRRGIPCPDPSGLVSSEKSVTYRDTRGPMVNDVIKLLSAPDRRTLAGRRDYALFVLLAENALRRAEIVSCNLGDFDVKEKRLRITGKGKGLQQESITLTDIAIEAISDYIKARTESGIYLPASTNIEFEPLFAGMSPRPRGAPIRLTANGLYKIVRRYGRIVLGRSLHPHALRHSAITATLDATGGDVRTAQRLSRHADVRVLQRYDDNRQDLQGKASRLLSALYRKEISDECD